MGAWSSWRPVLFFEYVPDYYPEWSPLPMFDGLLAAGYDRAIVYDQYGELLASVPLSDRTLLVDLHTYYSGRYADLCLFHRDDRELGSAFGAQERAAARLERRRIRRDRLDPDGAVEGTRAPARGATLVKRPPPRPLRPRRRRPFDVAVDEGWRVRLAAPR